MEKILVCKRSYPKDILNYISKNTFLIADNRTYHFQAEDEADQRAWMSVLVNCKERALLRAFDASGKAEAGTGNPSLVELQQAVIRCVMRLPGNDQCCDCSSQNGKFENVFRESNVSKTSTSSY